ncbi:hypothetical protein [Terrihabitans sp. B22-R8]|uniref:hypothetical protein n=1 Tax=Terrihabitans sp. B22-R8 TaxID=3425128 RepID=UPI00403C0BFE
MLLDNIAEAIWKEHAKAAGQPGSLADAPADIRERFQSYARAALVALSTPTSTMLAEGNRALSAWEHSEHYRSPIGGIWKSMLAAELPEKEAKTVRDSFDEV